MPSPIVQKTSQMTQKRFEKSKKTAYWFHILRILELARKIAATEKADLKICELGIILHDIGYNPTTKNNQKSKTIATAWLHRQKYPSNKIQQVEEIIEALSHSITPKKPSLETKIAFDCHALDKLGAIGISRTMEYAIRHHRALYSQDPKKETTTRHITKQLIPISHQLHTKTAKRIAAKRIQFMKKFLRQLKTETTPKIFTRSTPLVNATVHTIRARFEKEKTGHDWEHIRRVWTLARIMARQENTHMETVELTALLHDIADWKENEGNSEKGPAKARKWLEKNHAPKEQVEKVCESIRNVSFKGAKAPYKPTTIEGQLCQDADRLDAIGAIGIYRAIAFGTSKKRILYNPAFKPKLNMTEKEHVRRTLRPKNDTTLNHFYEKLLLLKDRMNTKTGRKIANQRHAFLEQFLEEFLAEWDGKR